MILKPEPKPSPAWFFRLFHDAGPPAALLPHDSAPDLALRDERPFEPSPFVRLFNGLDRDGAETETAHPLPAAPKPVLPDDAASEARPVVQARFYKLRVANGYREARDVKTFRLRAPDGGRIGYRAGQYIDVLVTIDGIDYRRSYSLSSSPSRPETLDITLKRVAGGVVSNWLIDRLKIGDSITVGGPYGHFGRALETRPKILFLAAGSGVVPIMSMLRQLADAERPVDVILLLSFRTRADIIFRKELNLIADRHPNITLIVTLTGEAPAGWSGLTGRIDQSCLGRVPDLAERNVYLCGPEHFMRASAGFLADLGHPRPQLFCESFQTASPPADQPAPVRERGAFRIKLKRSGITVDADGLSPLLNVLDRARVPLNRDCRSGQCGECMVKCLQGRAEMSEQAEISDSDRGKGWVYTCCAFPRSDLVLDI